MEEMNLLNETFELYYKKAKANHEQGNKTLAKRYYMLAAEQMLKMAKASDGELQKARFSRAKSLLAMAESVGVEKKQNAGEAAKDEDNTATVQQTEKISLEEALRRLNALEGLANVKSRVCDWVDQIKVFQMRKERGMSVPDMSYHMVFTGNPGTGKTTVARLMAQIYCALGIVSEGQLVEVDSADMVSGYVSQTPIKTKGVIRKALGGVLFIDEAYALLGKSAGSFGPEAIDTLLKEMEDKRDNLVVIAAGYDEPMENFINANPGLRSRFKNFIHFDDYNGTELFRIFERFCEQNQYRIEPDAKVLLQTYFHELFAGRGPNFGNGRDVRNLFENVVTSQSRRVSRMAAPTNDDMCGITVADLPMAVIGAGKATGLPEKPELPEVPETPKAPETPGASEPPQNAETPQTPEEKVLEEGKNDGFGEFKFDWDSLPVITFDDVAGLESVKQTVEVKVLLPLKNPEAFEGYVKKNGGGLLLYGPPGTGKTMIAAAIANEIGAKFCSVKPSDLLHQGAGQSEKSVRALFAQARSFPCSVIYFDEMDSIAPKSTKSQYAKQMRSELLAQLQGIESYGKETGHILFLIAATNKPWDMDSAFVRPGRFGTRVYVGLPDDPAREYMIRKRLEKLRGKGVVQISDDIDVDKIVQATKGFNGSDISNLLDRIEEISITRGIKENRKYIGPEDFDLALTEITSSVQREDIERLMEWKNENGERSQENE